ncbi:MAG TPA: TRAP transporter substrate-binding protein DctP, partial [Cobetia sp.]|nr:TRAP transporter substrate-binding protein DctP [Cobetia sp.]
PPMYILLGSLQEVQKYLTLANIQYSDQFLVANGQLLESLSDEERTALLEAVQEANAQARQDNQSQVESRIASLEEQGMQVIRPSEADLEAFRSKGQPAYLEWLKSQDIAPELIDTAMKDAGLSS